MAMSIVGISVVLELVLFAFEPYLARHFQYDAELGFRVKPYSGDSNQFGFRDVEYSFERSPGVYRIVCIGDSFGWRGGMDGNYTALLERRLERDLGTHRVDVINTGYSMTDTVEQVAILRRYGMAYHPDLVILGFNASNDFVDASPNRKRIVLMDTYFDIDARHPPRTLFGRPILPRSRLITLLTQRLAFVRELFLGGASGSDAGMSEESYLPMTGGQMNFYNKLRQERGEFAPHVASTLAAIDQMRQLVSSQGAQFAVAIFPADFSVDRSRAELIFRHFGMKPEEFDLGLAQTILRRHLEHRGIPLRDLLPDFLELSKQGPTYLPMDGHWNARGNAAAATLLETWLRPQIEAALRQEQRH